MNHISSDQWQRLNAWGWHCPKDYLIETFNISIQRVLPECNLLEVEMVAYNQDRNQLLLRFRGQPDKVIAVYLNKDRLQTKDSIRSAVVFEGLFDEFAEREQQRHEIQLRLSEQPKVPAGICPVCFAIVADGDCSGIWSGRGKPKNGPVHIATCKECRTQLVALPTTEQSRAGILHWDFLAWDDDI